MSQTRIDASHFSPDVQEFLRLLYKHEVKYLLVGGEAVIYYGYARLTGDVDFYYKCDTENASKLFSALSEFWGGNIPETETFEELTQVGLILQFGVPPNRIDLINSIDGVEFDKAWKDKNTVFFTLHSKDVPVHYISLENLIENKEASGRPKDAEDLKYLNRISKNSG
ncbi:MAG: hypothetical protein A2161_20745 [Candidatus Schekmanbacteria bacterium RBG_13_48_7]|uniref:Uncharacterized protein n=1 Tax=Candidatus Schekmanbacteria bacterium RBG_13_48_7 TaxID=1817878 RepID=A0A1F7RZQ6_9BACT|nr:MAG: hypothetical protein A2161_20745 [Candidatus Schekmanbacteria bacterium RBG_13_48_7]